MSRQATEALRLSGLAHITAISGLNMALASGIFFVGLRMALSLLPGLAPQVLRTATCLYTVTPDGSFVFDHHPDSARVLLVSACSGHGFKHSAAIGEAVAQRVLAGRSDLDLSSFALTRFHATVV